MTDIIIVPGIGGSGDAHWQTRWEKAHTGIRRIQPTSWDQPDLTDWMAALDRAMQGSASPPWLIGHSLGCLLIAHWQRASRLKVAGALLVALPDPQSAAFPEAALGFANPPKAALRFPSLMVASSDDPYSDLAYSRHWAQVWGSDLVDIGAARHINGQSGLGDWPQGWELLNQFITKNSA